MLEPDKIHRLDQPAFELLFKAHFAHLCHFAQQYIQDQEAAKDITQKVFIYLWENRANMDQERSLKSYLFTAVRNRCLNYLRDRQKYRSRLLDVELEDVDIPVEAEDFALEELQQKIAEALAALPEKCRLVFEKSRFEHKKYAEIAEELDISVKTVEAHMARALKGLKEQLKDYYFLLCLVVYAYPG
ncbi:MAG TPA: RNA polymerase sigma-70 factor [Saprospiraceae bacterium]|nr:RNA polymerase sigma-70 factor [Saprospiraceae bacterium]HMQ82430.1 RNA polymerase sigma-70 factor [Saprospiraceae bacterium]